MLLKISVAKAALYVVIQEFIVTTNEQMITFDMKESHVTKKVQLFQIL
jgi:hypothetical protein